MKNQTSTESRPPPSNQGSSAAPAPDLEQLARAAEQLDAGRGAAQPGGGADAAGGGPSPRDPAKWREDARWVMGAGLDFIGAKVGIDYSPDTKDKGSERLAAVMAKYEHVWPLWFVQYKEELALGSFVAGLAYQTWVLVNAARKKQAEEEAAKRRAGGDDQARPAG